MIEDDDVRAAFLDPEVFGESVTITPQNGAPFNVVAIFDARPVETGGGFRTVNDSFSHRGGAALSGASPQMRCRSSDVAEVKAGRAIVCARGQDFAVHDIQADSTGMTLITLKKA